MAMTLRADKGAILSWTEMDANFKACMGVHNFLHVDERQPANTAGGTFTSGAWRTRSLNNVISNNITGATLTSSQITLPAGEYYAHGSAVAYKVGAHITRIYNITGASQLLLGMAVFTYVTGLVENISSVDGRFSLSGTSVIELQHACITTCTTTGFGGAVATFPGSEALRYAELEIWKLS